MDIVKKCLGIKKMICHETAGRWMKKMGYGWMKKPSGQYVDGQECEDVISASMGRAGPSNLEMV